MTSHKIKIKRLRRRLVLLALVLGVMLLGLNHYFGILTQLHLSSEEKMALSHGAGSRLYEQMVDELIGETGSSQHWERRIAAIELGHLGPGAARAVPALEKLLQDPEMDVRAAAAIALVRVGSHSVRIVQALIGVMGGNSDHEKYLAATALGMLGQDAREAVPALIRELEEGHEEVRQAARTALERIGTPEALEAVNPQ